jgi:hypothetical protein
VEQDERRKEKWMKEGRKEGHMKEGRTKDAEDGKSRFGREREEPHYFIILAEFWLNILLVEKLKHS